MGDQGLIVGQGVGGVAISGTVHARKSGVSLSLALAQVVDTSVQAAVVWVDTVGVLAGNVPGGGGLQGGVVGDDGSVGIGHQAGVSLSLGLVLAEIVGTAVVAAVVRGGAVPVDDVGSGGDLQGGVVGDHSPVGVGHQAGTGIADSTNEDQVVDHGWMISPECHLLTMW